MRRLWVWVKKWRVVDVKELQLMIDGIDLVIELLNLPPEAATPLPTIAKVENSYRMLLDIKQILTYWAKRK